MCSLLHCLRKFPYDVRKDLAPVAQMTWSSRAYARMSSPRKSVNDLVVYATSKPGQFTFASGGNATPAHFSEEFLKQRAGIDMRHIPYKVAICDQADLMFAATTASDPHIRSGLSARAGNTRAAAHQKRRERG